jgi:RHS repeat-associated protein
MSKKTTAVMTVINRALKAAVLVFMLVSIGSCGKSKRFDPGAPLAWEFRYDSAGHIVSITGPAHKATTIKYKADRMVPTRIRKIVKKTPGVPYAEVEFDDSGRPTKIANAFSNTRYEYNGAGGLKGIHSNKAPVVRYTYDTMNRLSTLQIGDDFTLHYAYDFLGRLVKVGTPSGDITYRRQTRKSRLIRTLPNGIRTIREYFANGNLKSITHIDKKDRLLMSFTYRYRPDNLIEQIIEQSPQGEKTVNYRYDSCLRLIALSDSSGETVNFTYDQMGNRIEKKKGGQSLISCRYDWADRLVTYNGRTAAFDAAGNTSSYIHQDKKRRFTYNNLNLLENVSTHKMSTHKVAYRYDGDGKLVTRVSAGQRIHFVTDPQAKTWKPLLETGKKKVRKYYTWEGNRLLGIRMNSRDLFFLHDHQGSVRAISDSSGKVIKRLDYTPFGIPQQSIASNELQPCFAGMFYDPAVGLYITRARTYDPQTGRFLQIDPQHRVPLGSPKDLSPYTYCGGDPVNYIDQTGYQAQSPWYHQAFNHFTNPFAGWPYVNWEQRGMQAYLDNRRFEAKMYFALESISTAVPHTPVVGSISKNIFKTFVDPTATLKDKVLGGLGLGTDVLLLLGPKVFKAAGDSYLVGAAEKPLSRLAESFLYKGNSLVSISKALTWVGNTLTAKDAIFAIKNKILSPSNVGGVYMRGAGEALEGLGELVGMGLDEKGRLILLSKEKGAINLPPLRMDDVVTVFRQIYQEGDAPFVSIDPIPSDPQGPRMSIRHSPGTDQTYVGWVLFETDRIMKSYSMGRDNITKKRVESQVEHYQDVLDAGFFSSQQNRSWERFWIVPAAVNGSQTRTKNLTLFQVPLKVMTQRMVMQNGKLKPAPNAMPSKGAAIFAKWFSQNYDNISAEALSPPPMGSGIDSPVAVFTELRRIALISAIAETLRNQGVAMPAWMWNYQVNPCSITRTTPAINTKRSKGNQILFTYGGVNLSPEDRNVHIKRGNRQAEELARNLFPLMKDKPSLQPVILETGGQTYKAAALPGNHTRVTHACKLHEQDLNVPVQGNFSISLGRKFNSYFAPSGIFGKTWTMNLPILKEAKVPIRRVGDNTRYKIQFEIITPLNTYSQWRPAIYRGSDARIGFQTRMVILSQGQHWHFNSTGLLVGIENGSQTVIYRRNKSGLITRIEGWNGQQQGAHIRLNYDSSGLLISASGSNNITVSYTYIANENREKILQKVSTSHKEIRYKYNNDLVTHIFSSGQPARQYEYNLQGKVQRERINGTWIDYSGETNDKIQYDKAGRPLFREFENNTQVRWRYLDNHSVTVEITDSTGRRYVVNQSANGKQRTLQLPEGDVYRFEYDVKGQLTALFRENRLLFRQQWHSDGKLARAMSDTFNIQPQYRKDGYMARLLITPPTATGKKQSLGRWLDLKYNEFNQIKRVKDDSGTDISLKYDKPHLLNAILSNQGSVKIKRDPHDRIMSVQTSWDLRQDNHYTPGGNLEKVVYTQEDNQSIIEFEQNLVTKVRQFDGGEFQYSYYHHSPQNKLKAIQLPNGLILTYKYDANGRPTTVTCGNRYRLEYEYDKKGRLKGIQKIPVKIQEISALERSLPSESVPKILKGSYPQLTPEPQRNPL